MGGRRPRSGASREQAQYETMQKHNGSISLVRGWGSLPDSGCNLKYSPSSYQTTKNGTPPSISRGEVASRACDDAYGSERWLEGGEGGEESKDLNEQHR
eukprot:761113-Hanusia_phi.AAC.8